MADKEADLGGANMVSPAEIMFQPEFIEQALKAGVPREQLDNEARKVWMEMQMMLQEQSPDGLRAELNSQPESNGDDDSEGEEWKHGHRDTDD